jgi:hypothetical protein
MKRMMRGSVVAAAVVLAAGCASRSDVTRPQTQDNFGVRMAKQNLWREAMFRFRRAVEINPSDAMAHNNLAVAYEANGDFESARKEYLEALKLDRGNAYIQKNYSRYVEFLSRNKKRTAPKTVSTTTTAPGPTPSAGGTPVVVSPPDKPVATEPARPPAPPATRPSDLPPPQPTPPPTPPPGGAR